jgi:hypothetical protein
MPQGCLLNFIVIWDISFLGLTKFRLKYNLLVRV